MWSVGSRVVDADVAAVEVQAIELFNRCSSVLDVTHGDEAEATGAVSLAVSTCTDTCGVLAVDDCSGCSPSGHRR